MNAFWVLMLFPIAMILAIIIDIAFVVLEAYDEAKLADKEKKQDRD